MINSKLYENETQGEWCVHLERLHQYSVIKIDFVVWVHDRWYAIEARRMRNQLLNKYWAYA